MFYFKTFYNTDVTPELIEKLIRKNSVKRNISLDLQRSSLSFPYDKEFLALEKNNEIDLTRIRTNLEILMPKLILKFDLDNSSEIKVRLSTISFLTGCLLFLALILNIIYSINSNHLESSLPQIAILISIFIILSFFEILIYKRKFKKLIRES